MPPTPQKRLEQAASKMDSTVPLVEKAIDLATDAMNSEPENYKKAQIRNMISRLEREKTTLTELAKSLRDFYSE